MGSVPENPDRKVTRYFLFQQYRRDKELTAEEVAEKLERESPAHLYHSLSRDGFPVCLSCGGYAPASNLCDECHEPQDGRRRPTGTGEAEELPPVANASHLFSPVVEELSRAVRDLHHRKELYRAGRFEQMNVYDANAMLVSRDVFPSEEAWRATCEAVGQEPSQESFTIFPHRLTNAIGADATPRETALIVAYFLVETRQEQSEEQKLDALLELLHLNPQEAERQKLLYGNLNNPKQHPGKIEELRRVARQVARLVRGVPIGGSPAEQLTNNDLNVAWYITDQLRAGRSYAEVKKELIERGLKATKIDDLKNLGASLPH
jgi:hypothetical protein